MSEAPASPTPISIVLVDDHQVLTDALTISLNSQPDMQVAGVAHTCAAARALLERVSPTVLLLDVDLPDGDGLSLAPEVRQKRPEAFILVLTSLVDDKTLLRAVETGVNGFVVKNQSLGEIIGVIRQAAEGEMVMPSGLLRGLLARVSQTAGPRGERAQTKPLTLRELEILGHVAAGESAAAIAAALNIAPLTARTHIRNILSKLGAHSRLEAVALALRQGLIEPPT